MKKDEPTIMSDDAKHSRFSDKHDLLSLGVAVLSLVVAIAGTTISIAMTQGERQERVLVDARPAVDIVRRTSSLGDFGSVVQISWEVTIRNVGLRDTSIVDYHIDTWNEAGLDGYTGLDGGVYDSYGNSIEFPIALPASDSFRFLLFVGVVAAPEADEVLVAADADGIAWDLLAKELGQIGIDLFGNPVGFEELPGGSYIISQNAPVEPTQFFRFEFTTVQGDVASTVVCAPPQLGLCLDDTT